MTSRLQSYLDNAQSGRSVVERAYGAFPIPIALKCGPEEIQEVIVRLDRLAIAKAEIPEWDGDSSDDIWKDQKNWSAVLAQLAPRFPAEVSAALRSRERDTRFWAAIAMRDAPHHDLTARLDEALSLEQDESTRKVMAEARYACASPPEKIKSKRRWFWLRRE